MEIGDRFGKLTVLSIDGTSVTCRCDCGTVKTVEQDILLFGVIKSCGCDRESKTEPLQPGTRYGKLVVMEDPGQGKVLCQCDCGKRVSVARKSLINGKKKSCGCGKGRKKKLFQPGTRFGKLVVMEDSGDLKIPCQCDCGKITTVNRYELANGYKKDCGCVKKEKTIEHGKRFGKLVVVEDRGDNQILCKCDCGNTVTVDRNMLRRGKKLSCGCGRRGEPIQPGTRFGKLVVVEDRGCSQVFCQCDCGKTVSVARNRINKGEITSCGCSKGRKREPLQPGTRFGKLVVLEETENRRVLCRCDCGKTVSVRRENLTSGKTKSCGCGKGRKKLIQPGTRFGKLVVMEDTGDIKILCQCDCGKTTTVNRHSLTSGNKKSCGCEKRYKGKFIQPGTRFGKLVFIENIGQRKILCQCDCGKTKTFFKYNVTSGLTKSCGCIRDWKGEFLQSGTRFGKLVVTEDIGKGKILCQCDCGKTVSVTRNSLIKGKTKSCGCGKGRKREALQPGTRFGKLVVLEEIENKRVLCRCDCGKTVSVARGNLFSRNTKSCGCGKGRKKEVLQPGTRFGKLVVVDNPGPGKVLCQCDCGKTVSVTREKLISGKTKSCGCGREPKRGVLQPGTRFGKLVVVDNPGHGKVICECDCGKTVTVIKSNLKNGFTSSCGCGRKREPVQPGKRDGKPEEAEIPIWEEKSIIDPEKTEFGDGWRKVNEETWDLFTVDGIEWLVRLTYDGKNLWTISLRNINVHQFEATELREAMAVCEKMCYRK